MLGTGLEIGRASGSAFHLKLQRIFIYAAFLRAVKKIHYGIVDPTFRIYGPEHGKALTTRGIRGSPRNCTSRPRRIYQAMNGRHLC